MTTILFLYGDDTYRSQAKLRSIMHRYIDASLGDTNLAVLEGGTMTFETWTRQVNAFPFLAKSRLVVLKNLLLDGKKDVREQIQTGLAKIPTSTVVVFFEAGTPDKRTSLYKELNRPKVAEEFIPLVGAKLTQWAADQAREMGVTIVPTALNLLVTWVGPDLWRLSSELRKLAAFAQGQQSQEISEAMVRELVQPSETADIFQLIDAIAQGQSGRALREMAKLLGQGEAELYIFSMIIYQFRGLILVREALDQGITRGTDLARTLKMAPFVAEKSSRIARRFTLSRLLGLYQYLLHLDAAIKVGELEPKLGLELAIAELSQEQ